MHQITILLGKGIQIHETYPQSLLLILNDNYFYTCLSQSFKIFNFQVRIVTAAGGTVG